MDSSQNIIRVTESRRMSWAEHVARVESREKSAVFWWGNLEEREHLEDLGVDGFIIVNKYPGGFGLD